MRRRRAVLAGGGVAAVLLLGGAVAGLAGSGGADGGRTGAGPSGDPADPGPASTVAVERRDLLERTELSGSLGYGPAYDVSLGGPGTITALPEPGAVVEQGATVAEVDGRPVVAFYGDRPLWRPVGPGTDDGPDVRVVEENLIALGYGTEGALGPNERLSQATVTAIRALQGDLGLPVDGILDPADVVVVRGPVRVAEVTAAVGGPAGGPALRVTGVGRVVTFDLDARRQDLLAEGDPVEVVLPDGTTTPGTVTRVGRVATAPDGSGVPGGGGRPTVELEAVLDDPGAAGTLDQAPVTVRVTTSAAEDVLAVPVGALLALAEGGYAVERVAAAGTELVAVDPGRFADGWVAVAGDLAEGDEVVVP